MTTLNASGIAQEVQRLSTALHKILGVKPTFLRPPFGTYGYDVVKALAENGITHIAMWDLDSQDSFDPAPSFAQEQAAYNSLSTNAGHVVLNHDTVQATAETLVPWVITWVQARGLKAVTMGKCLGLPEASWYADVTAPGVRDSSWTCAA